MRQTVRQLPETLSGAMRHPRAAAREAKDPGRPRMLWYQDLVTCVLATWLIQGLTMDAWAHTNQTRLETVVTPWHALFYGGFGVTAGWILWQIHNNIKQGRVGLAAVPIGYGVALIGMGLFFLGRRFSRCCLRSGRSG